tara:strand:- start:147 stop:1115 length:969 start_codon:yes stop_codon:yes gene_type:complete
MAIFKPIETDDITITSTPVFQDYTLYSSSAEIKHTTYVSGSKTSAIGEKYTESGSMWSSLHQMFYHNSQSRNGEERYNDPGVSLALNDRPHGQQFINKFFPSGSVFSIAQSKFGERIVPGTFKLTDKSSVNSASDGGTIIRDDGFGNLFGLNAQASRSADSALSSSENYCGNIFYNLGLAVITETGSYSGSVTYLEAGTKDYLVAYKGQNTIHTLETTVRIEPNEFNRSINSTAKTFISGSPTTGGNEGSDINESEQLKPKLSGSGWSPYITAIQLYSGHKNTVGASTRQVPLTEPVLVAHLPRPVQAPTDQALTFKVRIDL